MNDEGSRSGRGPRGRRGSPLEGVGPAGLILWLAALGCGAWAAVRMLGLDRGFPLVPLIAYAPYVAIVAGLVGLVALSLRRWAAAAVALAATLALTAAVLPRALRGADPAPGGVGLVVTSANLALGDADTDELVGLVRERRTDVLSIQELTPEAARGLRAAGLDELLPERVTSAGPDSTGAGIYARFPLRRLARTSLGIASMRIPQAAVEVPGAGRMTVAAVHPNPPIGAPEVSLWHEGLRSLPAPDPEGRPIVLAGDFNATLDHSELRRLLDLGYEDAGDRTGRGLVPTWRSGHLFLPPLTIDHVLVGPGIGVTDYAVDDLAGTDHRIVTAWLVLAAADPVSSRTRAAPTS